MFKLYLKLKKAKKIKIVSLAVSMPQLRSYSLFYVKTIDNSFRFSIKIKTTLFSSFIPRFMFGEFEVYVSDDYDYCVFKSPIQFVISWTLLALLIVLNLYVYNFHVEFPSKH
jgi:hypothetical protein